MNEKPTTILLAEDDEEDRYLIDEALSELDLPHKLQVVEDGEKLLDYLYQRGDYAEMENWRKPGLILLDLNMPRRDGREILQEIKTNPEFKRIPVVVLTNSQADEDVLRSYDLGVSGYISKPVSYMGLLKAVQAIGAYWLQVAKLPPE